MPKKKKEEITIHSSAAEYLTYVAAVGDRSDSMEMRYEDENIWLTQKMMAQLYDVSVQNVGQHIKKIFDDDELIEEAVVKKYFITAADGKQYSTKHYNLQMIIAVGFKVNNDRAVRFRKWSGQIVKDYTIQGWTMDKERLKKGICSQMNILSVSCRISVKFVFLSVNFIKKSQTSMPQPLITIRMRRQLGSFSRQCRTKCTGRFQAHSSRVDCGACRYREKNIWG